MPCTTTLVLLSTMPAISVPPHGFLRCELRGLAQAGRRYHPGVLEHGSAKFFVHSLDPGDDGEPWPLAFKRLQYSLGHGVALRDPAEYVEQHDLRVRLFHEPHCALALLRVIRATQRSEEHT